MQALLTGLESLGVRELLSKHPALMQPFFVKCDQPLTAKGFFLSSYVTMILVMNHYYH